MSRRDVVVVVPGQETTCFDGVRELTEPTAVDLDRRGRIRNLGSRAGGPDGREAVVPFSATDVFHIDVAAAYIESLVGGFHLRHPVAAILTPAGSHHKDERWQSVAARLRIPAVLVSRPMAAAVGLGLEVDSAGGMLVVEVSSSITIVAVVADGTVVASVTGRGREPADVAALIRSVLVGIDPDLEWDVRRAGVHLLGDFPGGSWVAQLGERLDLDIHPGGGRRTLYEGALATMDEIYPYVVGTRRPGPQRRPGLLRMLK
jgi:hypothetical protein